MEPIVQMLTETFLEAVQMHPQLTIALMANESSGALLVAFETRTCIIPIFDRETALEACLAFSPACGIRREVRNCKPGLN